MTELDMDRSFAERSVNEGFSGGEKKRHEVLQLELLQPKIAVLDETDSGLDVDALRVVSDGINRVRESGEVGVLLITHYTRILRYVQPEFVHVFVNGRIVEDGGRELADRLESEGYERFLGAEVVITEMEHHSNIVPWQLACQRSGATLKWFGITDDGRLDLSNINELITPKTKVVSLVYVSNMLGTVNPIATIAARAKEVGALVVVDAAQAVPQFPVDVSSLGVDFFGFTGHKLCGPTGIG